MRVLAYTSPARGELFPVVPILRQLRLQGHEVAVRTLREHVGDLAALGLEAKPLAPEVVSIALDDWKRTRRTKRKLAPCRDLAAVLPSMLRISAPL
jgi:UDP:flavonoid glycosyltransferase YjiC (YdhE family)